MGITPEIKENNKKLAIFAGAKVKFGMTAKYEALTDVISINNPNIRQTVYVDKLLYHIRYDWLMTIIVEIKKLSFDVYLMSDIQFKSRIYKVLELPISLELNVIYNEVVEFVDFYNENFKNEEK